MSELRVAHFSDAHVLSLRGATMRRFANKRWTGAVNLAMNRSRHYRVEVFERLLEAIAAAQPDHTVCTGDLVNLALEAEFERVAGMLRSVFLPGTLTLVPGNHDYYVDEACEAELFEAWFADWLPHDLGMGRGGRYPVARLLDQLAVIGLCTAVKTPIFMATGTVGAGQLEQATDWLRHDALRDRFRLVLIHHPLTDQALIGLMRRLTDAAAVAQALRHAGPGRPDLIVHGHNHAFRRHDLEGCSVPVVQVGSASRAPGRDGRGQAEFNVYVITDGALTRIERHIHDPESGAFLPHDEDGRRLA